MGLDTKTDWLAVSRNVTLTLTLNFRERIGTKSTEELEVGLWRITVWLEDLIYV
jgi:hypothetical protein